MKKNVLFLSLLGVAYIQGLQLFSHEGEFSVYQKETPIVQKKQKISTNLNSSQETVQETSKDKFFQPDHHSPQGTHNKKKSMKVFSFFRGFYNLFSFKK